MITQRQFQRFMSLIDRINCSAGRGLITKEVERQLSIIFGGHKSLLVNSGTAALHLCLKSLGIGSGDEVIVPNFTFSATALAVKHCGATPVFAAVDLPSGWIDLSSVERLITERTKAIIPVHLNGYIGDMVELLKLAAKRNLFVIEDACQAFCSQKNNHFAGTMGIAGCFSFNSSKQLPAGEGGLIITQDEKIIEACRRMMRFGDIGLETLSYDTQSVGWNYKTPEIVAALIASQLPDIDSIVQTGRENWHLWERWCISRPFMLSYDLIDESPWRICLVPKINISAQNINLPVESGRWCRKPLSDQAFFYGERFDPTGLDDLRVFMSQLVWISLKHRPPS